MRALRCQTVPQRRFVEIGQIKITTIRKRMMLPPKSVDALGECTVGLPDGMSEGRGGGIVGLAGLIGPVDRAVPRWPEAWKRGRLEVSFKTNTETCETHAEHAR